MDMSSTGMAMTTATSGSVAEASTSAAMAMDMDMGGDCQISMLWNWYTVDSCFIASSWHVTSKGMFAGCCVGVILLVMSLELLRRFAKEYDRFILREAQWKYQELNSGSNDSATHGQKKMDVGMTAYAPKGFTFRPSILQQLVRALLHMLQFGVAYFVMLLAMYFNGYIIISIIIGAFLGAFVFNWESISLSLDVKEEVTVCCG